MPARIGGEGTERRTDRCHADMHAWSICADVSRTNAAAERRQRRATIGYEPLRAWQNRATALRGSATRLATRLATGSALRERIVCDAYRSATAGASQTGRTLTVRALEERRSPGGQRTEHDDRGRENIADTIWRSLTARQTNAGRPAGRSRLALCSSAPAILYRHLSPHPPFILRPDVTPAFSRTCLRLPTPPPTCHREVRHGKPTERQLLYVYLHQCTQRVLCIQST